MNFEDKVITLMPFVVGPMLAVIMVVLVVFILYKIISNFGKP